MKTPKYYFKKLLIAGLAILIGNLLFNTLSAQVYIPYSGSNSIACGTNTTLCTHAGCGVTYSTYANGYTVINSAGNAVITISGTYYTESCCDYVRIYAGSGTGGTVLATYQGGPTSFTYTGTAGQTLTVQFYSDVSVQYTGLNASVSFSGACVSEMTVPNSGNNSYTVCSGNLYDYGGSAGDYGNSWNGYTVLYPSISGNLVQVSGSILGESCCDYLYIYDGVGTGGTLLWSGVASTGTVPVTTSISGPVTVQFTSDGSVVGTGFNLAISCVTNEMMVPNTGSNSYTVCSGNLYDYGGSAGNYGNSWNGYTVLYPSISGNLVQVSGSISGESCCDYLYIYDGVGTGGTLLWSGVASTGTVPVTTSISGPVTVQFTSDGSVVGTGFNLAISCVTNEMMVPNTGSNSYTVCSGNLYDFGGSAGNYGNSWNGYTVLYPSISGNMVRVSGTISGESCCDYLYIYDGVGTGGTLLWSGVASTGTVPVTTSISGPVTVQFTSDGSVVGTGFNLAISCVAGCTTPGAPYSLSGYGTGTTTANISWTANGGSPTVTYYWEVYTAGGSYVTGSNTTSTSASVSGLTCGNSYYFRVYANTSCNNTSSAWSSNSSTFSTSACPDVTPPTQVSFTINDYCWIPDDNHVYEITAVANDNGGSGIGGTYGLLALINYQGSYSGNYGGYFQWNTTQGGLSYNGATLDQVAASGNAGGWAGKVTSYGNNTITLVSCDASYSGNQLTVKWRVRPNSAFPNTTVNAISYYTCDVAGNTSGWVNYQFNFASNTRNKTITCPSNITTVPGVVTYSTPTSACSLPVVQLSGLASGSSFPSGTTTNVWQVKAATGAPNVYFSYPVGASNATIALAACEAVYGVGQCNTGSCGNFSYYKYAGHTSCDCAKPTGTYEFIYSNTGYTTVGADYGGKSTDVTNNQLFSRVKSESSCSVNSWSLACPNLANAVNCSFTVNCPDPCSSIISMALGTTYNVTLGPTGQWATAAGCGWTSNGQEQVYQFTTTVAGDYAVVVSDPLDAVWYFVNSCSPTASTWASCLDAGTRVATLAANTTYYIIVDNYNTSSSGTYSTTVYPPPANPSNQTASPSTICPGSSSSLSASVSGCTIYWYTGSCGGTYVNAGSPISVSPTSTTTYYARAYNATTGLWSPGCGSVTVTVNPSPAAPTSVTATPTAVCNSGTVQLNATASGGGGGPVTALVLWAESGSDAGVTAYLSSDPRFTGVNSWDARSSTPTLAQLQQYKVVITWGNTGYADNVTLGNNLKSYVDAGGGVVVCTFGHHSTGGFGINGAFLTNNYDPIQQLEAYSSYTTSIGTISAPTHPIMSGVSSVSPGWCFETTTLTSGASPLFYWANGYIGGAYKTIGSGRTVGLNQEPIYDGGSHCDLLIANAAAWAGQYGAAGTINWYTVPSGGTSIGSSASGANFAVTPGGTTTYYAEAGGGGGTTTKTYLIPVGQLVNCTNWCGTGSMNNDCTTGNYPGFTWASTGSGTLTSLTIEFQIGVECSPTTHTTTLNGVSGSTFTTGSFCDCTNTSHGDFSLSMTNGYVVGGNNTFLITNPLSCLVSYH